MGATVDQLRDILLMHAVHAGMVQLGDLAAILPIGEHGPEGLRRALVDLGREEHVAGRPLLPLIVIDAATGLPTTEVLDLMRSLHLLGPGADIVATVAAELFRVHREWCSGMRSRPTVSGESETVDCPVCHGTGDDGACSHCAGAGCPMCGCTPCNDTGQVRRSAL